MKLSPIVLMTFFIFISGCGEVSRTTVYNDRTYPEVSKAENIRIKHIDGREFVFHRIEVVTVDENFIYARCWERKKSNPVDYKFNKKEVIIESTSFSANKAVNYIFLTVITVGLIVLINILLSE